MHNNTRSKAMEQVSILASALPYIKLFSGKIMVVKYGGNAMQDEAMKASFAYDIAMLKYVGIHVVVVHGGGPDIDNMMQKLNQPIEKKSGMRFTDSNTISTVEMVLSGKINREIVSLLCAQDIRAIGLSGRDARFMRASVMDEKNLGRVGHIESVDIDLIQGLINQGLVPVVSPIVIDEHDQPLNVNADWVASKLAGALACEKLILMTNTTGVLDLSKKLISTLSADEVVELIANKTITAGMLPKVRCSLDAIKNGVRCVHMIDGTTKHALLLEILTDQGIGTLIQ